MRLHLILPRLEPEKLIPPSACPQAGCPGWHFRLRQCVARPVRDTMHARMTAHRYECLHCRCQSSAKLDFVH